MARFLLSFILASLLALATHHGTHAVEFVVFNRALNTSGGVRFRNELGRNYTQQRMRAATNFIWNLFKQTTNAERKSVPRVSLFVDDMDGIAYAINNEIHVGAKYIDKLIWHRICYQQEIHVDKLSLFIDNMEGVRAYAVNNEIHVSASHIAGYSGVVKQEITGVLYHESTHICQWNGNGQAPGGLIEGIADFVRLRAGYALSHWVQPGEGDKWDKGYDVIARFLDYCTSLKDGFVGELNNKMKTGYSVNYFVDILGKNVDQLWADYKAKYGK